MGLGRLLRAVWGLVNSLSALRGRRIDHFLDRIGLAGVLERFVPQDDARPRLAPALVLGMVVRNLVTHREPVYALGEWAAEVRPMRGQ